MEENQTKTLQKQIETSEEAYSAIEDMLRPLEDPYTRILRPKDYELLKSSNFGSEINKKLDNLIIELKNHKDFKDLNLPLEFLFDCMIGYSIFNNMNTGKSLRDNEKINSQKYN